MISSKISEKTSSAGETLEPGLGIVKCECLAAGWVTVVAQLGTTQKCGKGPF